MKSSASGRLAFAVIPLLLVAGCHRTVVDNRPLPPGFPRNYVQDVIAVVQNSARYCQGILKEPDCYCHNCSQKGNPSGDPRKVVPLVKGPFEANPNLRVLHVRCATIDSPIKFCDSGPLDYPEDLAEACGTIDTYSGWTRVENEGEGEELGQSSNPACNQKWIQLVVQRKVATNRIVSLEALFKM